MNIEKPTHLDLFSGIGGFALAAQWAGFRTIGFCEIDKYCQKVLAKNFLADTERKRNGDEGCREVACTKKSVQGKVGKQRVRANIGKRFSPRIVSSIFDLDGRLFRGVDLITGGFPCQPFSVAGKRRGAADDRAIWPEMFRVIDEARPSWVLGENVPGIIPMELDNVLSDLEGIGYATWAFVIPACAVDARHRRDRVWIVGRDVPDTEFQRGCGRNSQRENAEDAWQQSASEKLSDNICNDDVCGEKKTSDARQWPESVDEPAARLRSEHRRRITRRNDERKSQPDVGGVVDGLSKKLDGGINENIEDIQNVETAHGTRSVLSGMCATWDQEPDDVPRVATRVHNRIHRFKGLGNAIVPQVAYEILREIRKQCR